MPLESIFSFQGYIGTPSTRKIVSREILNRQRKKFLSMLIHFRLSEWRRTAETSRKEFFLIARTSFSIFRETPKCTYTFFLRPKKCRMERGEISTREDFFRSSPDEHLDPNRRGCSEKIFFSRFAGSPLRGNFLRCSWKNSCQNKKNHHRFWNAWWLSNSQQI